MSIDAASVHFGRQRIGTADIDIAGLSDVGTQRSENQDRFGWSTTPLGMAVVLADGMGGGVGGGEAAEAALRAVIPCLADGGGLDDAVAAATAAVERVRTSMGGGMVGTTLVVAAVTPRTVRVANVGDSRAYLCGADGGIRALTRDHSRVAELVAAGTLTAEAARHDGRRNMLTRAVTGDPVAADIVEVEWRSGDTLTLCSDGVWEPIEDVPLGRLWGVADLGIAVTSSCQAALDAGSRDNVTVVAARLSAHAGDARI